MRLDSKTILVTGAGKGIGAAIARRLADKGATAVVTGHKRHNAVSTQETIQDAGGAALAYEMDVTDTDSIQHVLDELDVEDTTIDALVNNAGVSSMNPLFDLTEEEWEHNMTVNAKGVFLCSKHFADHMITHNEESDAEIIGKIINISSLAGRAGAPYLSHYVASKWAVLGFAQSIALELAEHGITVNSVCPGYVQTSMQDREIEWEAELTDQSPEAVREGYTEETPLGRLEKPEDVADAVVFLASNYSDFITGQAINTGGGIRMD